MSFQNIHNLLREQLHFFKITLCNLSKKHGLLIQFLVVLCRIQVEYLYGRIIMSELLLELFFVRVRVSLDQVLQLCQVIWQLVVVAHHFNC